jgi:hypothetical protein
MIKTERCNIDDAPVGIYAVSNNLPARPTEKLHFMKKDSIPIGSSSSKSIYRWYIYNEDMSAKPSSLQRVKLSSTRKWNLLYLCNTF